MTSLPSVPYVCLAITRKLRRSRTGPEGTPLLTVYPELTAEAVMAVVRPVLEERDREIARLRRELRDENDRILELLGGAARRGSEEGSGMSKALAERIAAAIEAGVCEPSEQCAGRFCPDCLRYAQAKADAAIARRTGAEAGKSSGEEGGRS